MLIEAKSAGAPISAKDALEQWDRLIRKEVRSFSFGDPELHQDLYQEAAIAVMSALDTFDGSKGTWVSHMWNRVHSRLIKAVRYSDGPVTLPVNWRTDMARVRALKRATPELTTSELMEATGWAHPRAVSRIYGVTRNDLASISPRLAPGDLEAELASRDLVSQVSQALEKFTGDHPFEAQVIRELYGIGGERLTLAEAARLRGWRGITRQAMAKRQKKALRLFRPYVAHLR